MKIKASLIASFLHTSPAWVSNGHWAVMREDLHPTQQTDAALKSILKRGGQFRERTDAEIERAKPKGEAEWIVGPWCYENREGKYRVLSRGESIALIDADYLSLLGVEIGGTMIGHDTDGEIVFGTPNGRAFVMPIRHKALPAFPVVKAKAEATEAA